MDEIIHHRVLPTDQNNTKNDAQPRQQPKKKKKNRIHDPLRHRLAADILRWLRRQRAGDCQVSIFFFEFIFREEKRGRKVGTSKERACQRNEKKNDLLTFSPSSSSFLFQPPQKQIRYSFEYPSNWKVETIGKQQKGMVGIDSKVTNPRSKRECFFFFFSSFFFSFLFSAACAFIIFSTFLSFFRSSSSSKKLHQSRRRPRPRPHPRPRKDGGRKQTRRTPSTEEQQPNDNEDEQHGHEEDPPVSPFQRRSGGAEPSLC